jgi:predicted component of type VI protein secretion system
MPNLLKVRLSLKGRPIRTYTFNKRTVTIGRDPTSDIFLDNTGVSRQHAKIERTPGGYVVEDMGSANGTLLNDQPVRQGYIGHDDVLQVGKFSMWMSVETDRREPRMLDGSKGPAALEGTMILDSDQLVEMQRRAREEAPGLEDEPAEATPPEKPKLARGACVAAALASFSLGLLVGAAAVLLFYGG